MPTVREWTGREAAALRRAKRMTVRGFAEHLGVAVRTVSKWEAQGADIHPYPDSQAILDTTLARSDADEQARFHQLLIGVTPRAHRIPVLDYESWADDLDRAVLGLGRQNFPLVTRLVTRWLDRFTPHELDTRGLYLHARSLVLLGDVRRDQGALLGPASAHHAYQQGLEFYGELDIPRRVAQVELSLAVITEMSGQLHAATGAYRRLAGDERLAGRDRARARLWVGTALSKYGENDRAATAIAEAARAFEDLDEPEDWSVAHQKLALAHRGARRLDQALRCIDVALASGVDDSPMQRVRLDTAHAHILLTDTATRDEGFALLERSGQLALQYGLTHQLRAIAAIRHDAEDDRAALA